MARNKKTLTTEEATLEVLQNIFILEAGKAGMPVAAIRDVLHIDKKRIGTISKHIKSE